MPDITSPPASQANSSLVAPEELRAQYPDLIQLILGSESMNDEERQYWVNILPIMTPEQIQNLRDILENEKQQLAQIDAKYSKEIEQIGQEQFLKQVSEARQKKHFQREQAEETEKTQEDQNDRSRARRTQP